MKIGLFTIYQVPNYGSVLQAYATQCILEKLGHECTIINYRYPNKWHWSQGAPHPNKLKRIFRTIYPSRKTRVLDRFRQKYYHLSRCFRNLDELNNADWSNYDAFIVGSDQVWNPRFMKGDKAFMLSFVPTDKARYSIASSFATDSLPDNLRLKYYKELTQFSAISVREPSGISIIQKEIGLKCPVEVVIDPTLLLSKEEWLSLIPRSSFYKKRPYILFYMWTYAFEPRPYIFEIVRYFQKQMDCEIIALEGFASPEKSGGIVMQDASTSTIPEFIDLFANADLVITSSFHGTAFAINFGCPLISIVPDNVGDNRQAALLKSVGAENCIVKKGNSIHEITPYYKDSVEKMLTKFRNSNIKWISQNIV